MRFEIQEGGASKLEQTTGNVLEHVADIAVLPQVVYKIIELTGSDESSAALMEREILIDPGFSAKLLRQANSAYYALPRKVTSIREAVMFLGFTSVRQLAMSVGVFDLFVGKTDRESLRRRKWWRHSLNTAVVARQLAPQFGFDAEPAYTAGLLHLIGKTLLDRFDSALYEKVELVIEKGAPDLLAERAVYGCDHVLLGYEASLHWGFPDILASAMRYATPPDDGMPPIEARFRAFTMLCTKLTGKIEWEVNPLTATPVTYTNWCLELLDIDEAGADELLPIAEQAINQGHAMKIG